MVLWTMEMTQYFNTIVVSLAIEHGGRQSLPERDNQLLDADHCAKNYQYIIQMIAGFSAQISSKCYNAFLQIFANQSAVAEMHPLAGLCEFADIHSNYQRDAEKGLTWSDPGDSRLNVLQGWVDSDFAADPDTRRSVTGFVVSLNNWPVAWKAKRQECTTLSLAEAEFVSASLCGQEVIYLRLLLRGFGFEQTSPTTVYEDNASCIAMSHNPVKPEHS
eukprot:735406-Rhodomonas_salina.1